MRSLLKRAAKYAASYFYIPQHTGEYVPHLSWFNHQKSLAAVDNFMSDGGHAVGVSVAEIFSRILTDEARDGALVIR